jgi:hypothetical protein
VPHEHRDLHEARRRPAFTALDTVRYAPYSSDGVLYQALTTSGVSEVAAGSGAYQVAVTFTDSLGYGHID